MGKHGKECKKNKYEIFGCIRKNGNEKYSHSFPFFVTFISISIYLILYN